MKNSTLLILFICLFTCFAKAQVAINTDGSAANSSAMLDVKSTTSGLLIPRVSSAQRNSIANPATGLFVFDTTQRTLYMFDGLQWLGFAPMTDLQRPANNFVTPPGNADTTLSGYSVSIWNNFAAIGAPYYTSNGTIIGAVFIYQLVNGAWQYFQTLSPMGNDNQSLFGQSVSLRGNYLIVGAMQQQDDAFDQLGAAYIYNYNGSTWQPMQTIFGSTTGINFGQTVSISANGSYAAISAPHATLNNLTNTGAVYVYNNSSNSFSYQATLSDASPVASEYFGTSMAINPGGNNIIVGAPNKVNGSYSGYGFAGQFDRVGTVWVQDHQYTPVAQNNLGIGSQVDINDNYVVFTTALTNQVNYFTLGWEGSNFTLTTPIAAISLDAVTNSVFVYSGGVVYESPNGSQYGQIKSLSVNPNTGGAISGSSLISVCNLNYVVGIPEGQIAANPYQGEFYFGASTY